MTRVITYHPTRTGGPPNLVFDGDSITADTGVFAPNSYPEQVLAALVGDYPEATITNVAQDDQTWTDLESDAASEVDVLIDPSKTNILCVFAGTNDFNSGSGDPSGATVHSRLETYCTNRKAAGWTVVVFTMLPRGTGVPADFETQRQAYNALILANYTSYADAVCDVGGDATIGEFGDNDNHTYYTVDGIHPNDTGHTVIAGLLETVLRSLL